MCKCASSGCVLRRDRSPHVLPCRNQGDIWRTVVGVENEVSPTVSDDDRHQDWRSSSMRHDAGPRVDATVQPALMPGGRVSVNQAQPNDNLAAIRKPRIRKLIPPTASAAEPDQPKPCWRQTVPQLKNVKLKKDLPPMPPAGRIDERPAGAGGRRRGPTSKLTRPNPGTGISRLARAPSRHRGKHRTLGYRIDERCRAATKPSGRALSRRFWKQRARSDETGACGKVGTSARRARY